MMQKREIKKNLALVFGLIFVLVVGTLILEVFFKPTGVVCHEEC